MECAKSSCLTVIIVLIIKGLSFLYICNFVYFVCILIFFRVRVGIIVIIMIVQETMWFKDIAGCHDLMRPRCRSGISCPMHRPMDLHCLIKAVTINQSMELVVSWGWGQLDKQHRP